MLARARTFTIEGLHARAVTVEIDIRPGLPAFTIVGLADAAVREARDRVHAALLNSGYEFPARRITANLAPADVPKVGPVFDLALACGVLAASGQISGELLDTHALFGELSLDGRVRACHGTLAVAEATMKAGLRMLVLAPQNAREATLVDGLRVGVVEQLSSAVRVLSGEGGDPLPEPGRAEARTIRHGPDLSDVRGQDAAVEALVIAAAGGHNSLLSGPPGTGKTMLAQRLPSILPPLERSEAIEVMRIHSVVGRLTGGELLSERPFRAPHHSITTAGLIGGARRGWVGEVVLAHNGVLFLDSLSLCSLDCGSMKLDGYCRVSQVRDRAGESFISPDLQRQQIEGWARLHGHTVDAWHTDLDQSGGKMDRPGFIKMMSRIESGQTQGVVVAKLDRFARSLPGALEAIKFLDEHSAAFVSVAEGVDPSTSAGKMMRNLLLVLAEFELDRVKDNWHAAISNAILERGVQPTVAPFGYRKDEHKRFVIDPDAGPYVREVFRRRLSGQTWTSIALWLNEEGIKPRSSAQWTGATVKQLTQREVYVGVASKGSIRREDAHKPLVSKADFLLAKEMLAKDNGGGASNDTRHVLNGIIRCAGCSRLMSGRGYKQRGAPRVIQYQCKVHHTAGTCPAPANVNDSMILPYVEDAFFKRITGVAAEPRADSLELTRAFDEQRDARAAEDEYRDDPDLQRLLGMDSWKKGLLVRQEARARADALVERAKQAAGGTAIPPVQELTQAWPQLSPVERKRLLASAIDVIYVRRSGSGRRNIADRVRILWRGQNADELSSPGCSVPIRSFGW